MWSRSIRVSFVLLAVGTVAVRAQPPADPLAVAKEAVKKAAAAEQAAHTEWNAREMARSATREIGVSARATCERSLQNILNAQAAVAQKQPNAEQRLTERITTMRAAVDRMINDQRVANEASDDLGVIEKTMAEKSRATRTAERAVLVLEVEAARAACAKTPTDKAAIAKVAAAERALSDADLVTALETQAWINVERSTLEQMAGGDAVAADIATRLAAVDPDPARKKIYQDFAARMTARKQAQEKTAAEKRTVAQAADRQIDQMRAASIDGLKPLPESAWDYAKARHLLVRAGFGATPDEVARLHAMGPYRAVEHLVDFHRQPTANAPFDATPPPPADRYEGKLRNDFVRSQVTAARAGAEGAQMHRLRLWWVKRLVESPRPLQEKLTLFWHGHFATQYSVVRHSYAFYQQNQMLRQHAAGNFGALLYGIVHDPVMIRYLDNNTNVKGHANENLAREIMELFAMGVDQGYTEKDIREAGRALTGYTYDHHTGQFRFVQSQHDETPKTIFGKTGNFSGDDLVKLILEQPATARFISTKLFRYFAHANPSPETIDQMAQVLRTNNYELAPLLKNLFLSEEFYSERSAGTQIKSPVQLVVGMLRDLGVKGAGDAGGLDAVLRSMGQELFEPPDVKGWREGRSWVNTDRLFIRYNAVANLVRSVPQSGVDLVAVLQTKGCCTAPDVVDHLAKACLASPLDPEKRKELIDFLGELPPAPQWTAQKAQLTERLQGLLILMLSTPEYQMT